MSTTVKTLLFIASLIALLICFGAVDNELFADDAVSISNTTQYYNVQKGMITMPYKSEKLKLSEKQDRRRKLTQEQKEEIKRIYESGVCGTRPLAKQFGVSRSMIQIIVNPNRAAAVKQRAKEHWRDYRPSKEEWAKTIREHRQYKQNLFLKGELKGQV